MSQDDSPDMAPAGAAPKLAPEQVALRAQPRPVTRLNRRMLAVLVGGVATAVLDATIWSLQASQRRGASEPTELYNVDRVSRSEGLAQLPGDLGGPILRTEQRAQGCPPSGHDPAEAERLARLKEAEEAAASSVFFRMSTQRATAATPAQAAAPAFASNAAFDPLAAGPAPTAAQSLDPTAVQNRQEQKEAFLSQAGSTQTRVIPGICKCRCRHIR